MKSDSKSFRYLKINHISFIPKNIFIKIIIKRKMSNTIHKELFRSENKINKIPTADKFLNKKVSRSASDVKSLIEKEKDKGYSNGKYKAGRWKKDEHIRFLKGCFIHRNNWKKVFLFNNSNQQTNKLVSIFFPILNAYNIIYYFDLLKFRDR